MLQPIDPPAYRGRTLTPGVAHFGVGGFHRSHQAVYQHKLLEQGLADEWAIVGIGPRRADARMRDALVAQDCAYIVETRHPDGSSETEVIGSIIGFLLAPEDPEAVVAALSDPKLRVVTLTITEGGYHIDHRTGVFDADDAEIAEELSGRSPRTSPFGLICAALARRRDAGISAFTVVSCDNIQGNGDIARAAVVGYAAAGDPDLAAWITERVDFPNSMVDRITPATSPADVARIAGLTGFQDAWPVVAEPFSQWIIEDRFRYGRPPWELVGVQLVDNVAPYEKLKLRVLNGAHQALAYFGLLLGYRSVADAAADRDLAGFVNSYLVSEVIPTLDPLPGLDVESYVESVLHRFANPAIGDTLERLATAGSDRLPAFVVPVAVDNASAGRKATLGAAVLASWWAAATAARRDSGFTIFDPAVDALLADGGSPQMFLGAVGRFEPFPELADAFVRCCADLSARPVRDVLIAWTNQEVGA